MYAPCGSAIDGILTHLYTIIYDSSPVPTSCVRIPLAGQDLGRRVLRQLLVATAALPEGPVSKGPALLHLTLDAPALALTASSTAATGLTAAAVVAAREPPTRPAAPVAPFVPYCSAATGRTPKALRVRVFVGGPQADLRTPEAVAAAGEAQGNPPDDVQGRGHVGHVGHAHAAHAAVPWVWRYQGPRVKGIVAPVQAGTTG